MCYLSRGLRGERSREGVPENGRGIEEKGKVKKDTREGGKKRTDGNTGFRRKSGKLFRDWREDKGNG